MVAEVDMAEYLGEIRKQVCARCVERPPDGPPCAPLGKWCGIELHLPQLIDAIHEVDSPLIEPYLEKNRCAICQKCTFLHSSVCPCPMDSLAVLLVQAVETVDQRRERRDRGRRFVAALPETNEAGLGDVVRAYEEAAGRWTGCDWPTRFGPRALDLNDCSADEAAATAAEAAGAEAREDWTAAADWLAWVEGQAEQAEAQAALAVAAASAGEWAEAVGRSRRARALEFACGRPIRRPGPTAWGPLCKAVEAAAARSRSFAIN